MKKALAPLGLGVRADPKALLLDACSERRLSAFMKLVARDLQRDHQRGGDPTTVTLSACYGAATPSVSLTVPPATFTVNVQLLVGAGAVVRKEVIWLP